MSFLDSLVNVGKSVWGWATGSSTAASLARTAALGFALNQITSSINKDNAKSDTSTKNLGVREQVDPDTNNAIPIVYGQAYLGGYVTDAYMTNDNLTMWYCLTICEKTGPLMSTNQPSVININEIYWNECRMIFNSDGVTAYSLRDESGNESTDINGLVKVYVYNDGSTNPSRIGIYPNKNNIPAYSLFPNWTLQHTMDNLVFALIRVDYNAGKNITGLGNIEFKVNNTMTEPGDVLYDYMTNTRYGAGINPEEIYSE